MLVTRWKNHRKKHPDTLELSVLIAPFYRRYGSFRRNKIRWLLIPEEAVQDAIVPGLAEKQCSEPDCLPAIAASRASSECWSE
ncbi:hypothetical protein GJV78_21365 [Escherichia alba]|uniref:Uncharacterized protein n=1 Tax=Intestinirhabdus alba TaxID=2899544 RepID=A0A6L6IPH2_9ENTR|nr:hypothetical protein [Intestinirhabdus alba]